MWDIFELQNAIAPWLRDIEIKDADDAFKKTETALRTSCAVQSFVAIGLLISVLPWVLYKPNHGSAVALLSIIALFLASSAWRYWLHARLLKSRAALREVLGFMLNAEKIGTAILAGLFGLLFILDRGFDALIVCGVVIYGSVRHYQKLRAYVERCLPFLPLSPKSSA